ncbi:MAG TPA: hypothetical protein VFN48_08410 [Solirubrobacteraceae bacterium]|nr:hypothetical protein [Solirubrobacteraceae bacterium]
MHSLVLADFLGLGHSLSAFGYSLALILTWFVAVPALATFLIAFSVISVLAERRENQARIRAYDRAHPSA